MSNLQLLYWFKFAEILPAIYNTPYTYLPLGIFLPKKKPQLCVARTFLERGNFRKSYVEYRRRKAGARYVKPKSLSTCRVPTPSTRRRIFSGKTNSERAFNILERDMWGAKLALEPAVRAGIERAKPNSFRKKLGLWWKWVFTLEIWRGRIGGRSGKLPCGRPGDLSFFNH